MAQQQNQLWSQTVGTWQGQHHHREDRLTINGNDAGIPNFVGSDLGSGEHEGSTAALGNGLDTDTMVNFIGDCGVANGGALSFHFHVLRVGEGIESKASHINTGLGSLGSLSRQGGAILGALQMD